MNRPRESVLAIFDPLLSSPRVDATLSSDKENATPPDILLLGTSQADESSPPRKLTKRLVEVGDVTMISEEVVEETEEPMQNTTPIGKSNSSSNQELDATPSGDHPTEERDDDVPETVNNAVGEDSQALPATPVTKPPSPFRFGWVPSSTIGPDKKMAPIMQVEYPSPYEPSFYRIDSMPPERKRPSSPPSPSGLPPVNVENFVVPVRPAGQPDFQPSPASRALDPFPVSSKKSSSPKNVVTFKDPSFHLDQINFDKMDPEFRRQLAFVADLILKKHGIVDAGATDIAVPQNFALTPESSDHPEPQSTELVSKPEDREPRPDVHPVQVVQATAPCTPVRKKGKERAEDFPSFHEESLRASTPRSPAEDSFQVPRTPPKKVQKRPRPVMNLPVEMQKMSTPKRKVPVIRGPPVHALRIVKRKKDALQEDTPINAQPQPAPSQTEDHPSDTRTPPAQRRRIEPEAPARPRPAPPVQTSRASIVGGARRVIAAPPPAPRREVSRATATTSTVRPPPPMPTFRSGSGPRRVPITEAEPQPAPVAGRVVPPTRPGVAAPSRPNLPARVPARPAPPSTSALPRPNPSAAASRVPIAQGSRIARFQPSGRTVVAGGITKVPRAYGRVPASGSKS